MKKIMWMAVLVIVIFLAGTVLGYTITILTNQQFRNAYPDDPLVRLIETNIKNIKRKNFIIQNT